MIPSQLPIFIQVVQLGSFSAASRKIGVSPAAISKSINQLEKQLNQRLFHRSTHSLALTEEGKTLFERTAGLVEALDENIRSSMDSTAEMRGKIKITLPYHFGQTVVYPRLLEFFQLNPHIELDLHFDDRVTDVVEHGFDLGIGTRINEDSRLIAAPIFDLQLIYVCSNHYAKERGIPLTPGELSSHACITTRSPTKGRISPWNFIFEGSPLQLVPKSRLVVNNSEAAFKAAKAGCGIACVGHTTIIGSTQEMTVVLDDYKPQKQTVWLYYSSRNYLPIRVRKLIDFLTSSYPR